MAKYELGGKILTEFVALTAKMYLYRKLEKKFGDKRYKGFRKCLVAKTLRLITMRPVFLMVKQCTESKCCLRIRNTRCTR